jgi:hypothetical protein
LTCRRAALRAYTRRIPQRGLTTGVEESETRQSQEAGENMRAHTLSHTNSLGTRGPIKKVHKIQEQKFFAPVEFPVQSPLPPDIEDYLRMIAKYDRHLVKVSSRRNASGHRVCMHFDLRLNTTGQQRALLSALFLRAPTSLALSSVCQVVWRQGKSQRFHLPLRGQCMCVYVCVYGTRLWVWWGVMFMSVLSIHVCGLVV